MGTTSQFSHADVIRHIPCNTRRLLLLGRDSEAVAEQFKTINPQVFCVCLRQQTGKKNHAPAIDQWVEVDLDEGLSRLTVLQAPMDMVLVMPDTWTLVKDPRRLFKSLRRFMTKDAVCLVWAPNVSSWQRMEALLRGEDLTGWVFDQPQIENLLSDAGWTWQRTRAMQAAAPVADVVARWQPLLQSLPEDEQVLPRLLTRHWLVTAVNGPAPPEVCIATMRAPEDAQQDPMARLSHRARITQPLAALSTLAGWHTTVLDTALRVPPSYKPGLLLLPQACWADPAMQSLLALKISEGWLLVADVDHGPRRSAEGDEAAWAALRGVHAVTVSTPALAHRVAVWNPNVQWLAHAIDRIPAKPQVIPKNKQRLRVFFDGHDRAQDWPPIVQGVIAAAVHLGDGVEFVVVHDRAFHDALPKTSHKTFHPSLEPDALAALLASCDLALLPLVDTPFNRCQSDGRLLACAAAGVVPIAGRVVHADTPAHHSFVKWADTPAEYMTTLIKLSKQIGELNRLVKLAHAHVSSTRMQAHQASLRRAVYEDWLADRDHLEAQRQRRLATQAAAKAASMSAAMLAGLSSGA